MYKLKLIATVGCVAVAAVTAGVAVAANSAASPKNVNVKQKAGVKMVPNRYIQDRLRFDKDVYTVRSGGTVTFVFTVDDEGPHTLTVLAKKDVPTTAQKAFNCAPCNRMTEAHGADPNNSDVPPKFPFVENGTGQATPPNIDRPGDSLLTGEKKNSRVTAKVTAKAGRTLSFICLVHPWMQARLKVVK